MAYIQPNSTVMLLRGVSIDKNYNHTYYFTSEENQYNFFANKVKPNTQYIKPYGENRVVNQSFQFGSQTYQRVNKKTIRLAILADYMYDCNYMMFQNTAYGNKWFYAFIDEINYINDGATEIVYTIDDMQTWYFDYELGQCFVEREHSETDNIGENIVPEDVNLGEYVYGSQTKLEYSGAFMAGFISSVEITGLTEFESLLYDVLHPYNAPNGIANGLYIYAGFPIDTKSLQLYNASPTTYYSSLTGKTGDFASLTTFQEIMRKVASGDIDKVDESAVVNTFQCPIEWFAKGGGQIQTDYYTLTNAYWLTLNRPTGFVSPIVNTSQQHLTYTPKNKKLLTYPYIKCVCSSQQGAMGEYKFEDFVSADLISNGQARFECVTTIFPSPKILATPMKYKNLDRNNDERCYDESVLMANMPVPAWHGDRYGQWVNQQSNSVNFGIISSALSSGLSVAANPTPLGIANAAGGLFKSIGSVVTKGKDLSNTPPAAYMQTSNADVYAAIKQITIKLFVQTIKPESAVIIDEYFNMFGYATNRVKVPNIRNPQAHLRPHWNYIKTQGCIIHPNQNSGLPADSEDRIAQIYDNGITFWTSSDEVGSYNLDNSPT